MIRSREIKSLLCVFCTALMQNGGMKCSWFPGSKGLDLHCTKCRCLGEYAADSEAAAHGSTAACQGA